MHNYMYIHLCNICVVASDFSNLSMQALLNYHINDLAAVMVMF